MKITGSVRQISTKKIASLHKMEAGVKYVLIMLIYPNR